MTTTKTRALWFALLAWGATFAACSRPAPRLDGEATRTLPWSDELVEQVASTPVQAEGRVKPLSVLAAFTLYDVHGRRDLKYSVPGPDGTQQKVTLEPTEWLLDVWCYPRQAARYPLFRIENVGVMDALGFANNGQRQDFEYLSYAQVYEVVDKLQELAQRYSGIEQRERELRAMHKKSIKARIYGLWRLDKLSK